MTNTSGWFPLLHKILVLPEQIETTTASGIVYVLDKDVQREQMIQVQGVVVACGPEVFSDKPNSTVPVPGDFVMFSKLAGFYVDGEDGVKYRMIQDLDLVAVKGVKHE
jgi:co-chaperonin GroES (HSP10)